MRTRWGRLNRSQRILMLGMAGICLLAICLALISTKFGAGIGTDGVVYVAAARNFLAGDGISWVGPQADVRPLAIFAPLLPFVLAVGSLISGQDAWQVARWLNALLFGLNLLLLAGYTYWYSRKPWLALTGGVMFAFSRSMIIMHTNVFSEPLFLAGLIGAVFLLSIYFVSEKESYVWASAGVMALSFLARYAGVYFIAAGALCILVLQTGSLRERVKPIAIWLVVNTTVVAAWFIRNRLVAGSETSRLWAPTLPPPELLRSMAEDISFWFLPEIGPIWLRAGAVALGLFALILIWWRLQARNPVPLQTNRVGILSKPPLVLGMIVVVYVLGLMATRSLVVPRIDIISRTLVPAHVLFLLLILFLTSDILDCLPSAGRARWMARGLQILLVGFGLTYALRGTELVANMQQDGQEYARMEWQNSPLINAMNLLPPETPIYTNHVEAVYFYTGRHPYRLPYGCLPEDVLTQQYAQADCQEPEYLEWVGTMREKLYQEQAVLVLFGRTYEQVYDPLIPELIEGLEPLSIQGDGTMYVSDVDEWPENPHW